MRLITSSACPTSTHPDAELACDAIKIATTMRGGRAMVEGVVFHTDRGSTYTAPRFTGLCERLGVRQSMGGVGSCFDNAAAEALFSTLEHEVLSRHHFTTRDQAARLSSPGARVSTTPAVGTVPPGCKHPTTTKRSPQNNRPRHDTVENRLNWGSVSANGGPRSLAWRWDEVGRAKNSRSPMARPHRPGARPARGSPRRAVADLVRSAQDECLLGLGG
jgi:transposase InsO family protein